MCSCFAANTGFEFRFRVERCGSCFTTGLHGRKRPKATKGARPAIHNLCTLVWFVLRKGSLKSYLGDFWCYNPPFSPLPALLLSRLTQRSLCWGEVTRRTLQGEKSQRDRQELPSVSPGDGQTGGNRRDLPPALGTQRLLPH